MKHRLLFLVIVIMAMMSLDAKAQGLVYTPFIPEQSSSYDSGGWGISSGSSRHRPGSYRPSSQTQIIRTTAYYADYHGSYYKVPIKVEYTVYSNGTSSLTVVERWEANAMGGQWTKVLTTANVMNCKSITAHGVTARLECTFMYKALVGTQRYYFDL